MTHAVVITAVCFDADGRPARYKVVDLRGEGAGDQGFFVMTDRLFDELGITAYLSRMGRT